MKKLYAYIRVSTLRQGEHGVSLQEQRADIVMYAQRHGFQIVEWFEEQVTAAKKGRRPLFLRMLKGLQQGKAAGVIIHKIDRSARNMSDWGEIGELLDAGVSVLVATDNLDLSTRSGRLMGDIQAVLACDYIRNLRDEIMKGIRGRLKQGIYPFGAPIGYLDMGGGKVKEIDPVRGPLIRDAFELYATGRHTLHTLRDELHRRGLRNRNGRQLSICGMSTILNNPFYTGLIRIKKRNEMHEGKHAALISMALFQRVRDRLSGKIRDRGPVHDYALRGLFRCSLCGHCLIGERQKGHIYYRCHTKACPTKTFREEVLETALWQSWSRLSLTEGETMKMQRAIEHVMTYDTNSEEDRISQIQAQLGQLTIREARLVDALLDGVLDKTSFEVRKQALLEEQQSLKGSLQANAADGEDIKRHIMTLLELASDAEQSYRLGSPTSRRELVLQLTLNRTVAGKEVSIEPYFPLTGIGTASAILSGADQRKMPRTTSNVSVAALPADKLNGTTQDLERTARELIGWAKEELQKRALGDNSLQKDVA